MPTLPSVHPDSQPPPRLEYDLERPWNQGVQGTQALPLINDDVSVMRVEAGPGTGKTFGLVRRVQRLLHPEGLAARGREVLVVAFNRVIAKQLETGINEALAASPHDGNPAIRTVHALCLGVIGGDLRLLMDHEREAMLYDVLEEHPELRARLRRQPAANQALHDHEARHVEDVALWQAVQVVRDVHLPDCQRCPVPVVVAANYLMSHYPPLMTGGSEQAANIHVVTWATPQDEARGMAKAIVDNIRRCPAERHLAMVTRRRFGYWLRDRMLEIQGDLGIDLSFSESILESWPTREAFLFASLLHDADPVTWRMWLAYANSTDGEHFKAPKRNAPAYLRFLRACNDTITERKVVQMADQRPPGQGGANLLDRGQRFKELRAGFVEPHVSFEERIRALFSPDLWIGTATGDAETARADLELLTDKTIALAQERLADHPESDVSDLMRYAIRQMRYLVATREPFVPKTGVQLQVTTLWGA